MLPSRHQIIGIAIIAYLTVAAIESAENRKLVLPILMPA